jgi:hypothetical protein
MLPVPVPVGRRPAAVRSSEPVGLPTFDPSDKRGARQQRTPRGAGRGTGAYEPSSYPREC